MSGGATGLSDEEFYLRLQQIIKEMPDFSTITPDVHRWLGVASFLLEEAGDEDDAYALNEAIGRLPSPYSTSHFKIPVIMHRALARAEAKAPVSARGNFIAAGKPFDALVAVSKILSEAKSDILVVDPYAEATLLEKFLLNAAERVSVRVLGDTRSKKPSLGPAADAWRKQFGVKRSLEVRLSAEGTLHDRLVFLDGDVVWVLGQSFNQLAIRSHSSLMKADPELAKLKVSAYEQTWAAATPLP